MVLPTFTTIMPVHHLRCLACDSSISPAILVFPVSSYHDDLACYLVLQPFFPLKNFVDLGLRSYFEIRTQGPQFNLSGQRSHPNDHLLDWKSIRQLVLILCGSPERFRLFLRFSDQSLHSRAHRRDIDPNIERLILSLLLFIIRTLWCWPMSRNDILRFALDSLFKFCKSFWEPKHHLFESHAHHHIR